MWYSAMHPVFSYLMDISTAKEDLQLVNEGLHKLIGSVLERHGKRKHDENEEGNAPEELGKPVNTQRDHFCGDSSPVETMSNELDPGTTFTTGYIDTRNEHKHVAPRGSSSRHKK